MKLVNVDFEFLEERAELNEIDIWEAGSLASTYYVLEDGTQVSFGICDGCRTNDHRQMFSLFDDIEYNDFESLLLETGMIGYCPETNTAWCLHDQELTEEQQEFIESNGIELNRDEI